MDHGTIGNDGMNEPGDKPFEDHPPFAPDCIFCGFATPRDATSSFQPSAVIRVSNGMVAMKPLDDESGIPWRKVWGNMQRCAWMDEELKWKARSHRDDNELVDILEGMQRCSDNAEAWRVWGLAK